jgi:hypothetical protein
MLCDLYSGMLRLGLKKRARQPWSCAGHPRTDRPCEDGRDRTGHDGDGKIWPREILLCPTLILNVTLALFGDDLGLDTVINVRLQDVLVK